MKEILFRGKRVDNGEWIYGWYIKADIHWHKYGVHKDWIVCRAIQNGGICNVLDRYAVNPETIGQLTGLCDKNGNRIFEGDIVEFTDKYIHKKGRAKIVFEAFKWKYSGCYYGRNPIVWLCIDDSSVEFEVIGNIYDNPELLDV